MRTFTAQDGHEYTVNGSADAQSVERGEWVSVGARIGIVANVAADDGETSVQIADPSKPCSQWDLLVHPNIDGYVDEPEWWDFEKYVD